MSTETTSTTATDATYTDLNCFERDVLFAARAFELDAGIPPNGSDVAEVLKEDVGYDDVTSGHLYPSLNDLADHGFIEKSAVDDRSNHYAITDDGIAMLEERVRREASLCGMDLPESAADDGGDV